MDNILLLVVHQKTRAEPAMPVGEVPCLTARYFQDRAARADLDALDRLLAQAGNEPPHPGDEVVPESPGPTSAQRSRRSRKTNQRRQVRGGKSVLRARLT